MSVLFRFLIFLLIKGLRPKTFITTSTSSPVSGVNRLSDSYKDAAFALQIQQIRFTSEVTPVTSAGNNLNDVSSSTPSTARDVQEENFLAISTTFLLEKKDRIKYNRENEGNSVLLVNQDKISLGEKSKAVLILHSNTEEENRFIPARNLLWKNCLETVYKNEGNIKLQKKTESANNLQMKNNKILKNFWNKRNINASYSNAMKDWLEKYNQLKNAKSEEKNARKNDITLFNKISTPSTITHSTPSIRIVPMTRGVKDENIENVSFDMSVTETDLKDTYSLDWFEETDKSRIKFSSLPQSQNYLIPKLRLEEAFHPFSFMSDFFALIYPFDFPIGLVKDIFWGKFSFPYSFIQSIKVESTFLTFIVIFMCIALIIPSYLIVLGILSLFSRSSADDETETGALFPEEQESNCSDRLLVFITFFIILLSCVLISGMVLSNEQSHTAATSSRNVVSCACADIAAWLATAARELHHSLVPPVDLVLYAYQEDLKNVETLLGEPIQQAIASESGIDLVIDSLADIIAESADLSTKIVSLRNISIKAGALAATASDKINDLSRQIDNLKKQCSPKDTPLCDTLNTHSLELLMKFNSILKEHQLLELRLLGVSNLTSAIQTAKEDFRSLPSVISKQTKDVRENILQDIESRRQTVHTSAKILNDIVRHLTASLHSFARQLESSLYRFEKYEFWRWTFMVGCTVAFTFVMLLMLCAIICGCGKAKIHAKRTLQVSSVWLCFISLLLWVMISAVFLIAGHAEVYICHALWDSAQYSTLSKLLDRPSPLLSNQEGIFDILFRDLENVTINVPVKDVLRDCERNRPAYIVFQLDKILDVNKETSYFEWEELQADLGRLASSVDVGFLKTISGSFNRILNDILYISNVYLAEYRMEYNGPLVGKDLPSLEDQLENIAAQVSDLTTSGRLDTLAKRTQRLYTANIKPLELLRADLVFKLTELELQLLPYRRKLNISLSHIHTAQYYIDNQGDVIAQKKVSTYVSRLISHAAGWRSHVLMSTGNQAAKCQPLFAVYSAIRTLLCTKYIASLHGWWVCGLVLGILWCTILTPLCVKLWRTYSRKMNAQDFMSLSNLNSAPHGTPATEPCDNAGWNTPGPPPPPQNDNW